MVNFRKDWTKSEHENYQNYKGYGGENLWFLQSHLPNINEFPNFEKFKSLKKINLYNYFNEDMREGHLFGYEESFFDGQISKINKLIKSSKIKEIKIYGYDFKELNELANTKFLDAALKMTSNTKAKINGIKQNTLKKFQKIHYFLPKKKLIKLFCLIKLKNFMNQSLHLLKITVLH